MKWNYPVDLFDDFDYLGRGDEAFFAAVDYPTKRSETHVYNKQTLGLRVATSDEIKAQNDRAAESGSRTTVEIEDLMGYIGALLEFMLESANNSHLHEFRGIPDVLTPRRTLTIICVWMQRT